MLNRIAVKQCENNLKQRFYFLFNLFYISDKLKLKFIKPSESLTRERVASGRILDSSLLCTISLSFNVVSFDIQYILLKT